VKQENPLPGKAAIVLAVLILLGLFGFVSLILNR